MVSREDWERIENIGLQKSNTRKTLKRLSKLSLVILIFVTLKNLFRGIHFSFEILAPKNELFFLLAVVMGKLVLSSYIWKPHQKLPIKQTFYVLLVDFDNELRRIEKKTFGAQLCSKKNNL